MKKNKVFHLGFSAIVTWFNANEESRKRTLRMLCFINKAQASVWSVQAGWIGEAGIWKSVSQLPKVWTLDQQHQDPLGVYQPCKFQASPHLLTQNLHFNKTPRWFNCTLNIFLPLHGGIFYISYNSPISGTRSIFSEVRKLCSHRCHKSP